MSNDTISLDNPEKKYSKKSNNRKFMMNINFKFEGFNEDIIEPYHWHINFAYYTGKGYTPLKLEDYHYFSENSQFGAQMRQIKGGSIRAFQENLNQLIQLIKVHLMPLLKEVKEADFYKSWFDKIKINDNLIQEEIKKNGENESNKEKLEKLRKERNEAIAHIKDKWVNEVDGGRLWQMSNSTSERGLDFSLLPQLFMGVTLDDPFQTRKTLKEQLDEEIYDVDVSLGAKESAARYHYKFHTWLPSAIKDTYVTYKLKISALKQFYSQIQMNITFMKPLLVEISRKSEGFEKNSLYHNFESENPEFANMFDYSYSFIRILGIRGFQREGYNISKLEFTKYGLYIDNSSNKYTEILSGPHKGKTGFIRGEVNKKYEFYPTDKKEISIEEFKKIEKVLVDKLDLRSFPIMEYEISQKRRTEIKETQQGPQQIPFMANKINYKGYCWNLYEIAAYRERLKEDNLTLLETFIEEIAIIKEDLLYYVKDLENLDDLDKQDSSYSTSKSTSKSQSDSSNDYTLLFGPFQALGEMFGFLVPNLNSSSSNSSIVSGKDSARDNHHLINKLSCLEDTWKVYSIFKKTHGYIMY